MTIGEKIKHYRTLNGFSQEYLGELSGINSATIKKYEYGIRNPKPDQLQKIATALGVSIFVFMDFDINTESDLLSLLMKMDEQTSMTFEVETDSSGCIEPDSIKISFNDPFIKEKLAMYLATKNVLNDIYTNEAKFGSKEKHQEAIDAMAEDFSNVKDKLLISKAVTPGPMITHTPNGETVPITVVKVTNKNE